MKHSNSIQWHSNKKNDHKVDLSARHFFTVRYKINIFDKKHIAQRQRNYYCRFSC